MCTLGGSLREKQKSEGRRRDKDRTVDQEQLELSPNIKLQTQGFQYRLDFLVQSN